MKCLICRYRFTTASPNFEALPLLRQDSIPEPFTAVLNLAAGSLAQIKV